MWAGHSLKYKYPELLDLQMSTEWGRAFVRCILDDCFLVPEASTDPNVTLWNSGRRSVGAELWSALVKHQPGKLTLALSEDFAEASRDRDKRRTSDGDGTADTNG